MPMNAEDMRGRQLQIDEATDKIAELHEERDELELDIDDMGMQELEQFEKIRRMEIEECERKCEIHWNNEERKQRNSGRLNLVGKIKLRNYLQKQLVWLNLKRWGLIKYRLYRMKSFHRMIFYVTPSKTTPKATYA